MPLSVQPYSETQITNFLGPWTRMEMTDVPPTQALLSYNMEYTPGNCSTRFGFGTFWNVAKSLSSLINWIKIPDATSTAGNYLFVYNVTDGKVQYVPNLLSPTLNDVYTISAEGISGSSYGQQFFLTAYTTGAIGAGQARIFGVYPTLGVAIDKAFLGPLTTAPVLTNSGAAGQVTAGLHRVGYMITTRNGFTGPISPVISGGGFDVDSNITAPGAEYINFTINPATWPTEAATIQMVMSPASNPADYYAVPYSSYAVVGGANFPISDIINISDEDLISQGTNVNDNQNLLTQVSGNGPFNPFKLIEYGGRMIYLTYDSNGFPVFYASEVNAAQQVTEQYHKRALPGFRQITTGFVLRGVLYLLGPNWTYSFEDTGGYPVTWPSATLIDGGVGSPSIDGVVVASSTDFAIVVGVTGAYVFNGVYQKLPISYMIDPDWRRINWAVQQTIRVTINQDKKQIVIAVPLDDATTPSHLMVFDYTNGLDAETIMYSLWNVKNAVSGYPRGLCVFQNPSTSRQETLIASSGNGKLLRQMNNTDDANPYRDDDLGVGGDTGWQYQIAPQPKGRIAEVYKHVAQGLRVLGRGILRPISYSEDNAKSVTWSNPITLQSSPGVEYYRQFDINAERCSTLYKGTGVDNYFILSAIRHQFLKWVSRR